MRTAPGFLEKCAARVCYPFITSAHAIASYFQERTEKKESYEELYKSTLKLREEYNKLLNENIKLRATLRYDQLSSELREFQQRYNFPQAQLAKILVKNITQEEHYFLVNKGAQDGIKKDMIALYNTQIVGKVYTVYDYYSKVILITDQLCKVAASTATTFATGIVHGFNDITTCRFEYVSHLLPITDQDFVMTSGEGLLFPEGFCLGKITKHTLPEKSLYHDIEIQPLFDLQKLAFVLLFDQTKTRL
jgi:rod shape-determining protein MreC